MSTENVLEKKTTVGISFVAKDDPAAALQDTNEANPKHDSSNQKVGVSERNTKHGVESMCERKKYQDSCINRGREPQPVIRWYSDGESCLTYVYNYCESFVLSDRTLRTEEECKELCLTDSSADTEKSKMP
ncbi:unnamed protein product [Enterobius vermicularis]|uniref:BPTI/Kunitz inhibitor domain-containing protein n=1 Tax=Enterobius vermicularis TaxID=51028 RepID=A0A0N4UT81_ENTVE|nr:unnamed protein product [Enterobius vermicularis]